VWVSPRRMKTRPILAMELGGTAKVSERRQSCGQFMFGNG